jgi:hypothetical protein
MIEKLIDEELQNANKKFPLFSSWHEAYAVILEEVEEADEETNVMCTLYLDRLWQDIRAKASSEADRFEDIGIVRGHAVRAIEELIQVAAMCDKAAMSLGKEKTE